MTCMERKKNGRMEEERVVGRRGRMERREVRMNEERGRAEGERPRGMNEAGNRERDPEDNAEEMKEVTRHEGERQGGRKGRGKEPENIR